jgi:hypothetical protein
MIFLRRAIRYCSNAALLDHRRPFQRQLDRQQACKLEKQTGSQQLLFPVELPQVEAVLEAQFPRQRAGTIALDHLAGQRCDDHLKGTVGVPPDTAACQAAPAAVFYLNFFTWSGRSIQVDRLSP